MHPQAVNAGFGDATAAVGNAPAERIHTLDVLRGVAICGILLMNIHSMGGVTDNPLTHFPAAWNAEWISWGLQTLVVQGAMRGLFTLLFGAGMLLMLRRVEQNGRAAPIDVWTRRCLVLMGFGTAQWLLFLWPGEILWNYGISGLILLAFRTARVRTLLIAAAVLIAGLSVSNAYWTREQAAQLRQGTAASASLHAGRAITADDRAAIVAHNAELRTLHPTPADRAEQVRRRTHLRSLLRWSAGCWATENLTVTGWTDIAESVSFMLIGMALFRRGILTGTASHATYRWMMIGGYAGGLAMRAGEVALSVRTGLDMGSPLASPWLWSASEALFEPARLLVTIGHVGLVVTALRAGWFGRAVTLRVLGRMTLTVYCLQSILGSLLFYGFGLVGAFDLPTLWAIAAGIWAVSALFCRWWLAHHDMGPGERLLRAIAYGPDRARAEPAPL